MKIFFLVVLLFCHAIVHGFFREADVVLLLGGVCDFRLNYGRSFHPRTKIIAVNRDRGNLYKNAYLFWKPTVCGKVLIVFAHATHFLFSFLSIVTAFVDFLSSEGLC